MQSLPEIKAPDDTLTAMARRAYAEYAILHRGMGMKFPAWENLTIAVKSSWKNIISKAIGEHGEVININRLNRNPHTIIITGLNEQGVIALRDGLMAKRAAAETEDV